MRMNIAEEKKRMLLYFRSRPRIYDEERLTRDEIYYMINTTVMRMKMFSASS